MAKRGKRFKEASYKSRKQIKENIKDAKKSKKGKRFKRKRKKMLLALLFMLLFIIIFVIASINIISWFKDSKENEKITEDIANKIIVDETKENDDTEKYTVNFSELKSQNEDTVAWLKVNGTNIEYPVVKSKDNSYYLTHSFDKTNNGIGWLFADYKNKFDGNDKNIIIYGHNRRDKSMFGTLRNALEEKWYNVEENRKIHFITEDENSIYEVFSIYKIKSEDYYIQTEFTDKSFKEFVETIEGRSIKDFGTDVSEKDQILTLSTCDNNNKYRVVVHARKIQTQ